jgi:pimeloyl-ACP methyl ester carboxylesterase
MPEMWTGRVLRTARSGVTLRDRRMGDYIEANGLKTYFERKGSGESLLLLHGGVGTVGSQAGLAKELARRFEVIVPERRWHGRTACVGDKLTYEVMAEDTIAFMDAVGMKSSHLVGHSDGANVAALVAIQRPDLARKLVMIGGNFNTDFLSEEVRRRMRGMTPEEARRAFPDTVDRYYAVTPDADARFPRLLKMLGEMHAADWRIHPSDLLRITIPTLIVSGDRDIIPLSHTLEMFNLVPNAQLWVIPGTGHDSPGSQPELVGSTITRFLTS